MYEYTTSRLLEHHAHLMNNKENVD